MNKKLQLTVKSYCYARPLELEFLHDKRQLENETSVAVYVFFMYVRQNRHDKLTLHLQHVQV